MVFTSSMLPCHVPVENPCQVWGAYFAGMRTPVHPDGACLREGRVERLDGDEVVRRWVLLFPNPDLRRSAKRPGGAVRHTLAFDDGEPRLVPRIGVRQRLRRQRQSGELADLRIVARGVLVNTAAPVADQAHLRARRARRGERAEE